MNKTKKNVLMTSTNKGNKYNKAINGMMKVLAQKQVNFLRNDFDTQKYTNEMLMIVLDIISTSNSKSYDDLMVRNFTKAVENYRKANKKRLYDLFGVEKYEKLFGGDEE